jgi:hypothetical protein
MPYRKYTMKSILCKKQKGFITLLAIGFLITVSILLIFLKDSVSRNQISSAQFSIRNNAKWVVTSVKSWIKANQEKKCLQYSNLYFNDFTITMTCSTYIDMYGLTTLNYYSFHYNITVKAGANPSDIDYIEVSDPYFIQIVAAPN